VDFFVANVNAIVPDPLIDKHQLSVSQGPAG
jgi:hypothetical protein